jgi:hypothetical protein
VIEKDEKPRLKCMKWPQAEKAIDHKNENQQHRIDQLIESASSKPA